MARKITEIEIHISKVKKKYNVKIGATTKYNLTYDEVLEEIAKGMNRLL